MPIDRETERFVESAKRIYDERLKELLETEHPGEIIAVEPQSGDYVLGATISEVDRACQQRFGTKPVHTFRIGGGGAVKVGGARSGRSS